MRGVYLDGTPAWMEQRPEVELLPLRWWEEQEPLHARDLNEKVVEQVKVRRGHGASTCDAAAKHRGPVWAQWQAKRAAGDCACLYR
jgi:hypothetical protein